MSMKALLGAAALAGGLAIAAPASANLVLQSGLVGGSGDVTNVVFNPCGLGNASGTTVQGCLAGPGDTRVNFTGNETLTTNEGGGQARITAASGGFDAVTIALADPALGFTKLQFNLDAIADGTATFQAVDQSGQVFTFSNVALDANGQNFFTLNAIDGQIATSFSLVSTTGGQNITDLQQVRIGTAPLSGGPTPVPEPASLALFGAGLLGLGLVRRRRTRA